MYNENMNKIYFDTEFTGLHKDTTLISIGMVSEHGNWFYGETLDYDADQCDDWIKDNVINNLVSYQNGITAGKRLYYKGHLNGSLDFGVIAGSKWLLSRYINYWLDIEFGTYGDKIQMYSDCLAYDWVLFNDLITNGGKALDIPQYLYYIPMDLSTALQLNDFDPDISRESFADPYKIPDAVKTVIGDNKHNSLFDAFIIKSCFEKLY